MPKNVKRESSLQIACVRWFDYQYPEYLLFAIPNGGARNAITGAILKAEGVRRGVADLMLLVPKRGYHGLFVEMKTVTGRLHSTQRDFITYATDKGYRCAVCRSFEEFAAVVKWYLSEVGDWPTAVE